MYNDVKVLLVDDEIVNVMLLEELVKQDGYFNYVSFTEPLKALEWLSENECDVIIADYNMPKLDGVELILKAKKIHPNVLSVRVTANNNEEVMHKALEIGVTDFLLKPISSTVFTLRLKNISQLKSSLNLTAEFYKKLEKKVEQATSDLKQREHETLGVLSKAAEYKDRETASHIARVSHYSSLIAKKINLSEEEQEILFYAAPLHDIGKIVVEDGVLLKPGKLTNEEFERMKKHSEIGGNILDKSNNAFLQAGGVIAMTHHEKYNGRGYPKGLKGEEIPLYGRIVAIADVFDALTSIRPYKKAWTFEDAKALIITEKGEHFDPLLVEVFIDSIDEVRVIFDKFQEG